MLQSIGELLISPIGYAMIGKLAPRQYQGVMMGSWMLVDRPRVALRGRLFGHDPRADRHHGGRHQPRVREAFRASSALGSLAVGIALVVLIPFLRKLITDKAETPPVEVPATVVPVA